MRVKRLPLVMAMDDGLPVARRVAHALREAIDAGRLASGEPLPSSRDLAAQLGVARNTVLAAIASLTDAGVLETRPGIGTFVGGKALLPRHGVTEGTYPFVLTSWAERLPAMVGVVESTGAALDFRPGLPDLATIPFDEWRRSAVRKMKTLRTRLGMYGEPQGDRALREEIARYVARSRGVFCDVDDVIVTSGAQQAFDLIARALLGPDRTVAFEEPGYRPAAQAFAAVGARLHGVPVGDGGLDVSALPHTAAMVYVTPSHQFPLGVTLADAHARALLEWAARSNAFIVEDDYDSEYRYGPYALPALQGSDTSGRVLYVGTFSKNLMPGIRLGYLVVPSTLRRVFVTAKWLTDRHSDNVSQSVLAEFMASGQFARHVARMHALYAARHACLARHRDAFARAGATLLPSSAGLHACIVLRDGADEAALVRRAAREGVGLYGLANTYLGRPTRAGLILGFGNVTTHDIDAAITRILPLLTTADL